MLKVRRLVRGKGEHSITGQVIILILEITVVPVIALEHVHLGLRLLELIPGSVARFLISSLVPGRGLASIASFECLELAATFNRLCFVGLARVACLTAVPTAIEAELEVESSASVGIRLPAFGSECIEFRALAGLSSWRSAA